MAFLLSGAQVADAGEQRSPGVDAEVVFFFQVVVKALEVGAVQVADAAAPAALEQKAVPVAAVIVAAELVKGPLLGVDLVDPSCGLQLFQLAVNGGKAHRAALPPQVLRQVGGSQGLVPPGLQAAENGLLLFRTVWNGLTPI